MNDVHTLTARSVLSSAPIALGGDVSVAALEQVAAELLALRPAEIDELRIISQIDRLEEPLLSILAYDFKIDWWDPEYTVEQKRQTLKTNWLVHKRLGTPYAVKTALGAVFPGAKVLEWFEYGGDPYCFRIDLPLPEEGVPQDKLLRAVNRIWYYKNLRSHLDSINIQTESTGFLRIGAYTAASMVIEIWPELVTQVDVTGRNNAGAVTTAQQVIEVFPQLPTQVEIEGAAGTSAITTSQNVMHVFPELATSIEITVVEGVDALTASKQVVEVFPELPVQVDVNAQAGAGAITASRQIVHIYPDEQEEV